MKTVIYYFSGTGNSLAVAKALAREMEGPVTVAPIAGAAKEERVEIAHDVLGIVCPTYFLSIPDIVKSFIGKLTFRSDPYVFAVVTCNGQPGNGLHAIARMLARKGGRLALGRTIEMPGNSLIGMDYTNPPEVRKERLDRSHEAVHSMAGEVMAGKRGVTVGEGGLGIHVKSALMSSFVKHVYRPARAFRAEGTCTRCGTCARVCPVGNVTMDPTEGPRWDDRCVFCLACLHWCPKRAIEMKKDAIGKLRYHHPDVTVAEIAVQRG